MNNLIQNRYTELCNTPSDIHEHLPTLKRYAEKVDHITEMGVRGIVSTYALAAGIPKKLISIDISDIDCSVVAGMCKGFIDFTFIQGDTTKISIEPTELLFIDTYHNYDQLKVEFERHANNVSKYIILHDTTTFGENGEAYDGTIKRGLWPAVEEFLAGNQDWTVAEKFENNNGLTVLERMK